MSDSGRRFRGILASTLTSVAILVCGSYLIWNLRPLILPVILGILLAYLCRPLQTAFKYRWLPNSIRVVLLFSVLTGGLLVGMKFIKDNIPNEKEKLEILVRLKYKFNEKFNKMMSIDPATGKGGTFYNMIAKDVDPIRKSLNGYLELSPDQKEAFMNFRRGVDGFEPVPDEYYNYFLENNKKVKVFIDPKMEKAKNKESQAATEKTSAAPEQSFLLTLIDIVSIWFLLPLVFLFFMIDDGTIERFFIRLVPNRYFELALTIHEEVDEAIGQYLRGMSMECALVGVSMVIGLFAMGIPIKMSLLIGILSGVATAIPFLGPVVGLSFGLVYVLIADQLHPLIPFITEDNSPIAVVVVNVVVLLLDNMVFQPIVLGGAVNLHPLVVILGIMGGSMLFGAAGVLLAIPAIVVFNVITGHVSRGLKAYRII